MNNITDYKMVGLAEGFEEGTEEQIIEAWQYLIDNDVCWTLPGRYGRIASSLIEQEICHG